MSRKGSVTPHVDLILDLYEEGFRPWQIALWRQHWTVAFVLGTVANGRRRGDPRGTTKHHPTGYLNKERFMSHHPRYFVGVGYQCLRCKAVCDGEWEFDDFSCTGDMKDFPKVGRKRKLSPEERLERGKRWVQPKKR